MSTLYQQTNTRFNIAIDGPAGAGKSTVARHVARKLGYVYIDTGAMYRAVALHMIQHGIQATEPEKAAKAMRDVHIELLPGEDSQRVLLNGRDVTQQIRTPEISLEASQFAQIEEIREQLVAMQRELAKKKGIVMDGRDIGTTVLPSAELKWFLTASVEERARRRYAELKDKSDVSLEQLMHEIAERDRQDENRTISPLRQAEDAYLLDTTHMTIEEIVDLMVNETLSRIEGEQ
ncbi:(d)CMP kinase [Paenibacillus sp. 1001270B_150601_E10]|uniref:(d)CMP kinase n=1 Tax=Paenibacillus sp. 1001270B_150601_E10 TaxID=2787079 RepID=UPI0018A08B3F|nr:(d)CMP kinase [Paenibacillus sp. 1001270B_150601_E10]